MFKKIYQSIVPYHIRGEIKFLLFQIVRILKIHHLLRNLNIFICHKYIQLNSSNTEQVIGKNSKYTKIDKIIEENDITNPAIHFPEHKLNEIQPFLVVSENIILDTINPEYSLCNNHLLDKYLNVIGGYRTRFETLPIYMQILPPVAKLKGTVAYLSDTTPTNYYHWMCATLPLIRFYQTSTNLSEIDWFYVGNFPLSGFHKETLKRAGISMHKVVQEACTTDRILAAISSRFIDFNDPISKEAYLFTRNLFHDECNVGIKHKKDRIYVKRGNATRRRVINEAEVIDLLEQYGFQAVEMDNKTVKEQAETFANAEAIVAPHGAALTNLLFAQSNTKVIEIFPNGYTNNCFYVLANYGDLNYFYLKCENISQNTKAHYLDMYVDIIKLQQICKMANLFT